MISQSVMLYNLKITKMKIILKLSILILMLSCSKDEGSPQEESTGYNMLLIGNSFFKPYADHLNNLASYANLNEHSSTVVKRGGELGRPINLWNDSNTEEHQLIKSTLDQGNIEVFGMTSGYDIDSENPTEGHSAWIRYALQNNPNIIIFIAIGSFDFPNGDSNSTRPDWDTFASDNGFEFCNQIKKDIKTSHIPILMVTAKGMNVDRLKGIDSGADAYLNKPFSMDLLRSHLKQLIKSRQILFEKYFNGMVNNFSLKNSNSLDNEFINNIIKYINENINDESLNVASLAGELSLSRSKLYRKIKSLTGSTANEFIRKVRLKKAKQLLENSEFNVSEVTYKVGFSSPSYFTKCFKEYYGVLPTEYRGNNISNQTAPLN